MWRYDVEVGQQEVDGYELEGLFRTSDPQNGEDMELVSIDYGYNHLQIKEQWDNIKEFLKSYASEKYVDITKKVNELGEIKNLEDIFKRNDIGFPETFEEWNDLNSNKQAELVHKAYEEYQAEVKDGKIPLTEKRLPLDLSKEQDQAFCRMEIKRLEKQGNHEEADNWRNYYNKNSPKEPNKPTQTTYNKIQHEELGTILENTEGRLQQENLSVVENANLDLDLEI